MLLNICWQKNWRIYTNKKPASIKAFMKLTPGLLSFLWLIMFDTYKARLSSQVMQALGNIRNIPMWNPNGGRQTWANQGCDSFETGSVDWNRTTKKNLSTKYFIDKWTAWNIRPRIRARPRANSRAAPSVEAHHLVPGPGTGRNSEGRRIIKNKKLKPQKTLKTEQKQMS